MNFLVLLAVMDQKLHQPIHTGREREREREGRTHTHTRARARARARILREQLKSWVQHPSASVALIATLLLSQLHLGDACMYGAVWVTAAPNLGLEVSLKKLAIDPLKVEHPQSYLGAVASLLCRCWSGLATKTGA